MYGEYNSLTEAAKFLNFSLKTISRYLKTEKKKILKKQEPTGKLKKIKFY